MPHHIPVRINTRSMPQKSCLEMITSFIRKDEKHSGEMLGQTVIKSSIFGAITRLASYSKDTPRTSPPPDFIHTSTPTRVLLVVFLGRHLNGSTRPDRTSRAMSLPLHQIVGRVSHAVWVVSQDGIEIVIISVVAISSLLGETADLQDRRVTVEHRFN